MSAKVGFVAPSRQLQGIWPTEEVTLPYPIEENYSSLRVRWWHKPWVKHQLCQQPTRLHALGPFHLSDLSALQEQSVTSSMLMVVPMNQISPAELKRTVQCLRRKGFFVAAPVVGNLHPVVGKTYSRVVIPPVLSPATLQFAQRLATTVNARVEPGKVIGEFSGAVSLQLQVWGSVPCSD